MLKIKTLTSLALNSLKKRVVNRSKTQYTPLVAKSEKFKLAVLQLKTVSDKSKNLS